MVTAKERPGLALETEKLAGQAQVRLRWAAVRLADTGNYTCVTDTATQTVLLVITAGNTISIMYGQHSFH